VKNRTALLWIFVIVAAYFVAEKTVIVVPEYEQVVLTEFGQPVGEARTSPGVYVVMPWYVVHRFPKQMLRWDGDRAQIPTKDKRFIWVDATARWRIVDPLKFLQSVRNREGAMTRLDDVIDSAVRQTISEHNLIEAVRPDPRPIDLPAAATGSGEELTVKKGREVLQHEIVQRAGPLTKAEYGVELVDVRLRRINYIEAVQANVFNRMIAERQKVAEQYRSEGAGRSAEITGSMERKLKEVRSTAYRQSREIEGTADAEATRIYAEAYGQDPEFYGFLQTLELYPKALGTGRAEGKTHMVLGTDSELLGYLRGSKAR
jgi:membrane protease subunit HflC